MTAHRSSGFLRKVAHDALVLDRDVREGRFQRSLALVAGASGALGGLEVALQHYRGSYNQTVMYSPIVLSALLLGAGVAGAASVRLARTALPVASWALLADGVLGFGFHIRGIHRKPGGWRIPVFNLVMGPPLFAPLLLGIGGFLGVIASNLRVESRSPWRQRLRAALRWRGRGHRAERIREGRFQALLAGATAASAALNGLESSYSHYKTAYGYRVQWLPVILSPAVVAAGVGAIFSRRVARTALPAASLAALTVGAIGTGYHVRGVLRRPGGRTQALYNLTYGPPAFAPLLYAATGFLGLLASQLRRDR